MSSAGKYPTQASATGARVTAHPLSGQAAEGGVVGADAIAGAEIARLVSELGALAQKLAQGRGNEDLVANTSAFIRGQNARLSEACSACSERLRRDAFADAVAPSTLERPVNDRRADFVVRLVVAFYPYGVREKIDANTLALPRYIMPRMGTYLRGLLGSLSYADINADCCRLLARFPGISDRDLRTAMFNHPPSRALLMKILVRMLPFFSDRRFSWALFQKRLTSKTWPNTFNAREAHFQSLCDGLFGEFLTQLQTPRDGDDLDAWFGLGTTHRVLDMLEYLSANRAA